jgi:hypothetical protein
MFNSLILQSHHSSNKILLVYYILTDLHPFTLLLHNLLYKSSVHWFFRSNLYYKNPPIFHLHVSLLHSCYMRSMGCRPVITDVQGNNSSLIQYAELSSAKVAGSCFPRNITVHDGNQLHLGKEKATMSCACGIWPGSYCTKMVRTDRHTHTHTHTHTLS